MRDWFEAGAPRCLVIGEIGQAHDGSLGNAHSYVDAVADAGADAVKFQTHLADAESTSREPWRVKFSLQDETRQDYWRRTGFTYAQWRGLADHARDRGLIFLSSPFSDEAVDLLDEIGVPAFKVASGEVTNLPLLERMAATGKPVMLSSGLSLWAHLDRAVDLVRSNGNPLAVFQCASRYPTGPEHVGLNLLAEIRDRYGCIVGLSDHSGVPWAGLAAATLGARLVEVHVTFSPACFGPDVPASLTPDGLARLVEGVRFIETALSSPVDKDEAAAGMEEMRAIFGKSVVAARDLPAGRRLERADLALKKPGTGLPPDRLGELLDRVLKREISADEEIHPDDLQ